MADYDLNQRAALVRTTEEATTAEILRSNSVAEGSLRKMLIFAILGGPEDAARCSITIKERAILLRGNEIAALARVHGIVPLLCGQTADRGGGGIAQVTPRA